MENRLLIVYKCPLHGTISVCVESGHFGVRFKGDKCCPRQYEIALAKFPISERDVEELYSIVAD